MTGLWQAHEPALTELGQRAEHALRFSFMTDVWAETDRHPPKRCVCYLLSLFFNHAGRENCTCTGCDEVRRRWRP